MRAASSGRAVHRLARKLSSKSEVTASVPGQTLPGTLGTVQSVNGDGTATVVHMGAPIPCQLLGDFVPVVGQGVLVLVEGERNWCVGPASTIAQTYQSVVDTVGYGSGWSDFGSGLDIGAYRMVGDMVQLRGVVGGPNTSGSTIFTLPAGYCPQAERLFIVQGGSTVISSVQILPSGAVQLSSGNGGGLWLDPIQFSVS